MKLESDRSTIEALSSISSGLRNCRLCWRVTAWVFVAILLVEGVILFFSVERFEQDRISELEREGLVVARSILRQSVLSDDVDSAVATIGPRLSENTVLKGMVVRDGMGRNLASFGTQPTSLSILFPALVPEETVEALSGAYLSIRWPPGRTLEDAYYVEATINIREVASQVRGFILRISGLVLVISLAVTAVTMLVVERFILRTIRDLSASMHDLASDPQDQVSVRTVTAARDELSEVVDGFNRLRHELANAFVRIRQQSKELIEKETLKRANEAKSTFLANMSHEMRTPLNAIVGFSTMIRDQHLGPLEPKAYVNYADDIAKSGEHLLGLIEKMFDIERVERGKIQLAKKRINLETILQECWNCVKATTDKHLAYKLTTRCELPAIEADENAVRQIFINILSNAVKYTPEPGSVDVTIQETDTSYEVSVCDSGPGIDPSIVDEVVQPFWTTATHAYHTNGGLGLGLAIANGLVMAHQGQLRISPRETKGTIVVVEFPKQFD